MPRLNIDAEYRNNRGVIKTHLSLVAFKENEVNIVYSPALDLSGYGKNEAEAKKSFSTALEQFITYTDNKKTFFKELEKLGWKLHGSKNKRNITAPDFLELLDKNHDLSKIVKEKDFKKFEQLVEI